jgi:uncharacterized iron-regulated membrane protein
VIKRAFRKYHRLLALIISLPLGLTILSGMVYSVMLVVFPNGPMLQLMMKIHTGSIVKLGAVYPTLTGLGSIGLLVTGVSLLWGRRSTPASLDR